MTGKKVEHVAASDSASVGADQLVSEFKTLMADAEALIKATEDHPGDAG